MICNYGCGKEASFYFKNVKKWCCSKFSSQCSEIKKKGKLKTIGKSNGPRPEWVKEKISKTMKISCRGKRPTKQAIEASREVNRQRCLNGHSLLMNSIPRDPIKIAKFSETQKINGIRNSKNPEWIKKVSDGTKIGQSKNPNFQEEQRQRMLNGQASYMLKFVKTISKQEIKLRDMVKQLYPTCEFQCKVFNYSLDVAILEYKIAIEYDGYHHFKNQESIDYHNMRQKKIESKGWKFYRVTMFDKFPDINELKQKIEFLKESV